MRSEVYAETVPNWLSMLLFLTAMQLVFALFIRVCSANIRCRYFSFGAMFVSYVTVL